MPCSATRCAKRAELSRYARADFTSRWAATPDERERAGRRAIPMNRASTERDARRSDDVLLTRFDAAALVPVLQGRQYLLVHVERASDILAVLDLKREFPRSSSCWSAPAKAGPSPTGSRAPGIPVIASAVNDLPASFEQLAATQSNVGRMRDAGVKVVDRDDRRQRHPQPVRRAPICRQSRRAGADFRGAAG